MKKLFPAHEILPDNQSLNKVTIDVITRNNIKKFNEGDNNIFNITAKISTFKITNDVIDCGDMVIFK